MPALGPRHRRGPWRSSRRPTQRTFDGDFYRCDDGAGLHAEDDAAYALYEDLDECDDDADLYALEAFLHEEADVVRALGGDFYECDDGADLYVEGS